MENIDGRRIPAHTDITISKPSMAQLVVRDLDEDVKRRRKRRAERRGRSTRPALQRSGVSVLDTNIFSGLMFSVGLDCPLV